MTLVPEKIYAGTMEWWEIMGRDCAITIEKRPSYCDRGDFIAKLHPRGRLALEIDHHDGWPRYYFDWERMLAEIEAWLAKRGQIMASPYMGIVFTFKVTSVNALNTHVSVFAGEQDGALGFCGRLVMRNEEYAEWVDAWLEARPDSVTFVPLSDELRKIGT